MLGVGVLLRRNPAAVFPHDSTPRPETSLAPPRTRHEAMLFSNIDDGYLEGLLRGYRAGILTSTDYQNLSQCETIDGAPRAKIAQFAPLLPGTPARSRNCALRLGSRWSTRLLRAVPSVWPCSLTATRSLSPTDMKMHLASTDYGNFLQNEPSPISTTTLAEKCTVRAAPPPRARAPPPSPSHPPFPRPPQEKLVEEFNFLKAQASEPLATFLDYVTYGYMIDNMTLVLLGRGRPRARRFAREVPPARRLHRDEGDRQH